MNIIRLISEIWTFIYALFKNQPKPHPRPQTVIVGRQTTCKEIFSKDIMKRQPTLGLGDFFGRWLGSCLGCLDSRDPKWAQLKRIFRPLFEAQNNVNLSLSRTLSNWEANLTNLFNESKQNSSPAPIPIDKLVDNLPLLYILEIVFGYTFISHNKADIDALRHLADELMCISFNHNQARYKFYRFLPTKENSTLTQFMQKWERLLNSAKHDDHVRSEGCFHLLLDLYENTDKRSSTTPLKWEHFSQTLIEVTFANQDVTTPSLAWLLVCLSTHHAKSNSSHQHFIEETARMCPIANFSMPKITTKDLTINGQLYKAGTSVIVNLDTLGNNPDWDPSPNLDTFNPDRFNSIPTSDFVGRFGFGARKCPGNKLTNTLFEHVVEHISLNWVLLPISPSLTLQSIKAKTDPSKPFRNPVHSVYLLPKSFYNSKFIYYDCHPYDEIRENGFMAISVNGRSPFLTDPSLANKVVKHLSDRNKDKQVLILICDDIAKYNLRAFDHHGKDKSISEARKLGDKFYLIFNTAIIELQIQNVSLIRWKDIIHSNLTFLKQDQGPLSQRVTKIAERFIEYRGQNLVQQNDTSYMKRVKLVKKYIYSEIGVLVNGVHHDNLHYRVLYYCGTKDHLSKFTGSADSLHNLILAVHNDPEHKDVYDKIVKTSLNGQPKCQGFIGIEV